MGTAKVPLRELANLFNHLPANTKAQLQSAFADAEDSLNFNNNANTGGQDKRQLSSLVASPILTSTTNSRGFEVSWRRLDDKRISFYEVQVSFDSIFADPDDYKVVDTSISLEGIGTTVYVRVRGVRFDGLCGPWSDSLVIDAFATSAGPLVYSRGFDDIPGFYKAPGTIYVNTEVQHISITPQRQSGGIVVFGSIGFENWVGPSAGDNIKVRLNSTVLDDFDINTTPYTLGFIVDPNTNQPSFSIAFGPAFLTHDDFAFSTANDLNPAAEANSGSGSGTFSGWTFTGTGGLGTPATVFPNANKAHYEQTCTAVGETRKTKYLHLTNLGAAIPGGNTIVGIEATMYGDIIPTRFDPTKSNSKVIEFGLINELGTRRPTITTGVAWPDSLSGVGAIPTVTFGGSSNLFGEVAGFWTPAKVNDPDFGIYVRGQFHVSSNDTTAATEIGLGNSVISEFDMYGLAVTIFSINADLTARVDVIVNAPNGADLLNCSINAIEFGDSLTS